MPGRLRRPRSDVLHRVAKPLAAPPRRQFSRRAGSKISGHLEAYPCGTARFPKTGTRSSHKRPSRRRSEEHTSELQSQSNLVCRLLLEKKKKKQHKTTRTN